MGIAERNESAVLLETDQPQNDNRILKSLTGWRKGVTLCFIASSIVFIFNLTIAIWASRQYPVEDGFGLLQEGSCSRVRYTNIGVHLVINVLSTVLLSSSNYCMQCLSAPSREDVDRAHRKRKWLDIGTMSLRNLTSIGAWRPCLWLLLCMSSLPLHLFYNSTIFTTVTANTYSTLSTTETFLQPDGLTNLNINTTTSRGRTISYIHSKLISHDLEKLDNIACINAYAQNFMTSRGHLVMIVDTQNETFHHYASNMNAVGGQEDQICARDPFAWICGTSKAEDHCNEPCQFRLSSVRDHPETWSPYGKRVKYCLGERLPEQCRLQFSLQMAIVVIVMNGLKAILMLAVLWVIPKSCLITIGDAVASWMMDPDPTTEKMCLLSRDDVQNAPNWPTDPRPFTPTRHPWAAAVSRRRWRTLLTSYTLTIAASLSLLVYEITHILGPKDLKSLWSYSFGAITPITMIGGWNVPETGSAGLLSHVIIANLPQPILSILYFLYNSVITSMLVSAEWNDHAHQYRGLRVSAHPRGFQRTKTFLQLPYRYSVPLMGVSAILHWLGSQCLFFANIRGRHFDADAAMPRYTHVWWLDIMTNVYAPMALALLIVVVGVLSIGLFLLGTFRKYSGGVPLAGNCSAAISAACHPPSGGDSDSLDTSLMMWGKVPASESGDADSGEGFEPEVYHCSFASTVEPPVPGELYS
ncbi:hypothetical protein BDV25DRAFT_135750 [Aspergillus avenaceus]|uniref:DUF6536 domain-containing protein n=1 Tax=Aspergillus avenaceus TaxID=36643 RepID=A0A5N6U7P9_ASPAV|nr:hypothetical protein BDV25DRAFT_135750 [Aspergillus avenaceus]